MDITKTRLIKASNIAREMNKNRDGSILSDFASSIEKWGKLTHNQHSYATALLERYEGKSLQAIRNEHERIKSLWDTKDEEFLDLIEFVCFFYDAGNCARYRLHVESRMLTAQRLSLRVRAHRKGVVPFPSEDVSTMMAVKLWDTLCDIKRAEPKYAVGDLISIRGRGQNFSAWCPLVHREGRFIRNSFQICIVTEVVNGTFRCKQPHPTKGTCRLYRVKAFSGGNSREILIEEDLIKPMK